LREGKSRMKCRICASECPPGAKLCRDCAAARKRAFAVTVTQPILMAAGAPSISHPRFAPRPTKMRSTRKGAAPVGARSRGPRADARAQRKASPMRWLLLGLTVSAAAVDLVSQIPGADQAEQGNDAAVVQSASEIASPTTAAPASAALPQNPSPTAGAPAVEASAPATPVAAAPLKRTARHKAPVQEEAAPVTVAPTQAAPVADAAPQRVAPPPPVEAPKDPWQAMNEGLSHCANLDWMHRSACEQRLRLQYCPNHWGSVWQCPIGPSADHG